jgi:cyanate lyase
MSPELVTGLTNPFFANGIVGAICVALALYILKQNAEARSERAAHKVELASKDALIKELDDARIAEAHTDVSPADRDFDKEREVRAVLGELAQSVVSYERKSWQVSQEFAGNALKIVSGE